MDEARTLSAVDWSARKAALHQATSARQGIIQDRLFGPMDPEIANSFTEAQILELERVIIASSSGGLPIDVRITVPFFWRRYLITFLAGPERRAAERLREDRAKHALWTIANVCFFVFLVVLFVPTFIGLVRIFADGV